MGATTGSMDRDDMNSPLQAASSSLLPEPDIESPFLTDVRDFLHVATYAFSGQSTSSPKGHAALLIGAQPAYSESVIRSRS